MAHCDREDVDFHFSYEVRDGELVKLNTIDEVKESWKLSEAPEEVLWDALDSIGVLGQYPDDLDLEALRAAVAEEIG